MWVGLGQRRSVDWIRGYFAGRFCVVEGKTERQAGVGRELVVVRGTLGVWLKEALATVREVGLPAW